MWLKDISGPYILVKSTFPKQHTYLQAIHCTFTFLCNSVSGLGKLEILKYQAWWPKDTVSLSIALSAIVEGWLSSIMQTCCSHRLYSWVTYFCVDHRMSLTPRRCWPVIWERSWHFQKHGVAGGTRLIWEDQRVVSGNAFWGTLINRTDLDIQMEWQTGRRF